MHPDGSHHGIALGINDADIVRTCIDHIDFIFLGIGCHASGFTADFYGLCRLECAQVNDRDRVALAVGDVGIFTVGGAVIRQGWLTEIPPSQGGACQRKQHHEEEEFSQNQCAAGDAISERVAVPGAAATRAPIAGTVLPNTPAICRTWVISSSNCSG